MPAADTSGASGRPLYAEPLQAHTLIAQGAEVGRKAGANAVSSLPGTVAGSIPSSPFDAAVQTAQISLPAEDAAAVTAAAASSTDVAWLAVEIAEAIDGKQRPISRTIREHIQARPNPQRASRELGAVLAFRAWEVRTRNGSF